MYSMWFQTFRNSIRMHFPVKRQRPNPYRERYVVRVFDNISTLVANIDLESGKMNLPPIYVIKQWLTFICSYFDILQTTTNDSTPSNIGQIYTYINHVINSYCVFQTKYNKQFVRELNEADELAMQLGHLLMNNGTMIAHQVHSASSASSPRKHKLNSVY